MINFRNARRFCCEDITKIENYEQAALDPNQMWDVHHRLEETTPKRKLIEDGIYFKRPASELVFLTHKDHLQLHTTFPYYHNGMSGRRHTEEARAKLSETRKAKIASGEIVIDTSACHTPEANTKISAKARERYQDKTNHPMYGKHQSKESRRKNSLTKLAKHLHWWTDGNANVQSKDCPGKGWTRGRTMKASN